MAYNNIMRLQNRVAIVTGASSGIGRGIALELAREGAAVAVADIREDPKVGIYHETEPQPPTAAVIAELGGRALFAPTDVADERQLEALVERTVRELGGLDIVVNNAGISIVADSQQLSLEQFDRIMAVNLRAAFVATKLAVPHLKRSAGGRIVHIASVHAFGGGGSAPYAASKAALVNLARDTALELGPPRRHLQRHLPGLYRDRHPGLHDAATGGGGAPPHCPAALRYAARHRSCGRVPGLGRRRVDYRLQPGGGRRLHRGGVRHAVTLPAQDAALP